MMKMDMDMDIEMNLSGHTQLARLNWRVPHNF
jgi:hypothetical protein